VEAQRAFEEGKRLKDAGKYPAAEAVVEHAQELRESVLPETHPKIVDCLDLLGEIHLLKIDYAHAEPLLERTLKIRQAALGENHPDVATSLNNLAFVYQAQGQYARAEPLLERALKIRQAALGENHPDVATSLNNLAFVYQAQGQYSRAEPLYQRALKMEEVAQGENHPGVAGPLNNLSALYLAQGQYTRAEPLLERALKILETALGENHPKVAVSLNNLALVYQTLGQYAHAEPLYQRALKIREAALGENHPEVANSLLNLASLYQDQGQYARAEPLYQRALKIEETTLGENHPDVAASLHNLAGLYQAQGQYARAEPLHERALRIWESTLGENHPDVATSLHNLAFIYQVQEQYARAEPLYQQALKIRETALGENHSDVATSLHNLATLYQAQGQYARAEPLYARALKILETALGENHRSVATALHNLALFRLAQQHLDAALPLFQRALASSEQHLRQEVFGLSEKRLERFLRLFRTQDERLYVVARAHPDNARVLQLALSAALLRKGRSVQEVANTSHIIYRSLDEADRETFERLRGLRTQLATLSLAGLGNLSPTDYQQRLKDLAEEGDTLEAGLARRSEPLRKFRLLPPPDELLSHVKAALSNKGVLVEFIAYQDRSLIPRPGLPSSAEDGPLRYLALLLLADGRMRAVDLGLAQPIDQAALHLHHALAARSSSYLPAAQALYRLIFRPLIPHLGKEQRLFLAPDGQLSLVPFAALHDGRRFLVDAFDITYLTSGKDLLPHSESTPSSGSVVVLADPDFSSSAAAPAPEAQSTATLTERSASIERFFSALRSEGPDIPWAPLPGTRQEAQAIQRLFPQAQLLLGADATKQALLKLSTPGLLHLATHGFFLEDTAPSSDTRAVGYVGAIAAGPEALPADPLLRSGLVLAGAHPSAKPPGARRPEDALVTALELAGLNLWGTQLVVLSACDTGRGDVKLGEGVYGLRRAFLVAGAETVVTSLWKVNDDVTQQLMEAFYRHLLAGRGRTSALREAMREMRRKQPHPYFWAAFTTLGSDAPLRTQMRP
jgi:CHAT domain-containing protein